MRRRQSGLSIVELMVGVAIGLFVVAAASLVVTTQLGDNRRLLLETQLQQDLRASADIITRELRRAGAWGAAEEGLSYPGRTSNVSSSPFSTVTVNGGNEVRFSYQRSVGNTGPYGFKLLDTGVIRTLLGIVDTGENWQDLTDGAVLNVTQFDVTEVATTSEPLTCPLECPGGGTDCWPTIVNRTLRVVIGAQSRVDPTVTRTLTTFVRLRNDVVNNNNGGAQICP
jgi:type IV pilus assembly protein PilW